MYLIEEDKAQIDIEDSKYYKYNPRTQKEIFIDHHKNNSSRTRTILWAFLGGLLISLISLSGGVTFICFVFIMSALDDMNNSNRARYRLTELYLLNLLDKRGKRGN